MAERLDHWPFNCQWPGCEREVPAGRGAHRYCAEHKYPAHLLRMRRANRRYRERNR